MYETIPGLAPAVGYRYADKVGDELFVAGQVPMEAQGLRSGNKIPASCVHPPRSSSVALPLAGEQLAP